MFIGYCSRHANIKSGILLLTVFLFSGNISLIGAIFFTEINTHFVAGILRVSIGKWEDGLYGVGGYAGEC